MKLQNHCFVRSDTTSLIMGCILYKSLVKSLPQPEALEQPLGTLIDASHDSNYSNIAILM